MINNRLTLAAIVPAFNEVDSVAKVVSDILRYADVVVVDDGSTDGTGEQAHGAGAYVVTHPHNIGYEKALESGLLWAAQNGYCFAVTLDADGQHHAATIALFARQLNSGADVVVGFRDHMQRWTEVLFGLIGRSLWNIRDPLCGMKGYRLGLLRQVGRFYTYDSIGTEFCIRAALTGYVIQEVPVKTSNRLDVPRFGKGLRPNLRIIRAIWLSLLLARPFITN